MDNKPEVLEQSASSFGLQIQKKKQIETTDANGNVESITMEETATTSTTTSENAPKTLEERAIEAIIKGNKCGYKMCCAVMYSMGCNSQIQWVKAITIKTRGLRK